MHIRIALIAVGIAAGSIAHAAPTLKWLNPVHNFGTFQEETGHVTCTFRAVNTGDEPVTVMDARANCGCTRPSYPHTPIAPGDTLDIMVSYDPAGRPGRFHKQVKITTNASEKPMSLSIRGTVIGSQSTLASRYPTAIGRVRVSNAVTPFGTTRKGRVAAAAVNIYNPTADTITPEVHDLPPYINALFRPARITPGEQGTLSLTAYTDMCGEWGTVTDSFTLAPDDRNPDSTLKISTVIIINEDFSKLTQEQLANAPVARLSTDMLDFGRIVPLAATLKKTFTITNNGHEPLSIRRLYTTDEAVSIKSRATTVKPGKSTEIEISIDPSKIPAGQPLNARLTVITNDPASPSQTVRIVGEQIAE